MRARLSTQRVRRLGSRVIPVRVRGCSPNNPRFHRENFVRNFAIVDRIRELAEAKGCTSAQLALAWLLNRHDNVIPIPGTSSINRMEENARATDIVLSDEELERIESVAPPGVAAGSRYDASMMQLLNG